MHARIDELLSLRDGEPVERLLGLHVQSCPRCQAQLSRLVAMRQQLRTLPDVVVAGDEGWRGVQRRLAARAAASRIRLRVGLLAAAASLAALAVVVGLRLQDRAASERDAYAGLTHDVITVDAETIADLQRRSLELEALLASLPGRPAVERAGSALPIESLEAQVQWVDHRLVESGVVPAERADTEQLWRDRVELMNSLVQLRYVEAQQLTL